MKPVEQAAWVANLAARLNLPGIQAPSVCVLDSGATQAHPLLTGALNPNDQHAFDANWGVGDSTYWTGHGTMMCGVALYGDLEAALAGGGAIHLRHRIETVKFYRQQGKTSQVCTVLSLKPVLVWLKDKRHNVDAFSAWQ